MGIWRSDPFHEIRFHEIKVRNCHTARQRFSWWSLVLLVFFGPMSLMFYPLPWLTAQHLIQSDWKGINVRPCKKLVSIFQSVARSFVESNSGEQSYNQDTKCHQNLSNLLGRRNGYKTIWKCFARKIKGGAMACVQPMICLLIVHIWPLIAG